MPGMGGGGGGRKGKKKGKKQRAGRSGNPAKRARRQDTVAASEGSDGAAAFRPPVGGNDLPDLLNPSAKVPEGFELPKELRDLLPKDGR